MSNASVYKLFASRPPVRRGPPRPAPSEPCLQRVVHVVPQQSAQVIELPAEQPALDLPADVIEIPPAPRASEYEQALIEILDQPPLVGEPLQEAFRRKEHALLAAFGTLSSSAANELRHRLDVPRPGDVLATKFGRLAGERRVRLLAHLSDPARRNGSRRGLACV